MKKTLLAVMAMVSLSSYAQLPEEGFETWPVSGWTTHGNGGVGITWQQAGESPEQPPYGGEYAAFLDKENVTDGTLAKDWLVSPSFMPPANAVLTFASRLTLNEDQGSIYKIMLLPSGGNPDVLSDYVMLEEWTEMQLNPVQKEYIIKNVAIPAAYTATSVRLAFYMENDNGDRWLVDDVHVTSECYSPTNLSVTSMTATSAGLSWTETGAATSWEIEIVPEANQPTGIGVLYSGSLPYTVTNLMPDMSYKYYVRALCPDGGKSDWVGPMFFPNVCWAPTNVAISSFDLNTVVYTWTPTGAAAYDYWYTASNDIPNASTIPTGNVVTNNVALANLDPAVNYKFYVRSHCASGVTSDWAGLPETPVMPVNIILGKVLYDSNMDGICDENDSPLPYTELQIEIGDVSYTTFTDQNGLYVISGLEDITYTLNVQVISSVFENISPLVQDIVFSEEVNEVNVNHCLGQPIPVADLEVTLIGITSPRPGFDATYSLVVQNKGSLPQENVVVNIAYNDDRISYAASSVVGATATAGILSIPVGNIQAFGAVGGEISFSVMQPPVNIGGESLLFEVSLSAVADDITPENNQAVLNQVIVNSFDPNDITVHEGAEIYVEQADDYLTYTIRFQNTGTAEAIDIKLENTLDDLLDWETFTPITSSHSYEVKLTGNLLEFDYKNILLPDSTANEPGSHGFVTYKVKPKAEYGLGDIVSNQAEIYFDFNPAIITNIATTEVIEVTAGVNDNAVAIARLYPNPVKDQLHVEVAQGELTSVAVYDINGRLCLSANANIIDTNTLNSGIYFVKVTTDAGSANYKIIKH